MDGDVVLHDCLLNHQLPHLSVPQQHVRAALQNLLADQKKGDLFLHWNLKKYLQIKRREKVWAKYVLEEQTRKVTRQLIQKNESPFLSQIRRNDGFYRKENKIEQEEGNNKVGQNDWP